MEDIVIMSPLLYRIALEGLRCGTFCLERVMMSTRKNTTRMLCEGAIMVALALILGLMKVFELPQAGSISLEMLPLLLFLGL